MLTLASPRTVPVASVTRIARSSNEQTAPKPEASTDRPSFLLLLLRALGSIHS